MSGMLCFSRRYSMKIEIDITDDEVENLMDFMDMTVGRTLDITSRQGSTVYEVLSRVVEETTVQIMQRGKK